MNISISDIILLAHAAFGVTGCLAALWVFVEALKARPENAGRIRVAALSRRSRMAAAWICGGYWYVHFYPAEKALILKGPWPLRPQSFHGDEGASLLCHRHTGVFASDRNREKLYSNAAARKLVLSVAALIAFTGLALEGAGAVIDHGVKVALLQSASKGAR